LRPITLRNPNLYKGPATSREFNQLRNDIQYDLTTLYGITNDHDKKMKDNMDVLLREQFFMQNRIEKLQRRVAELEQEQQAKETGEDSKMLRSFYHMEGLKDGDTNKQVSIDVTRGIVSPLTTKMQSKLSYVNDKGDYIIPKSLQVTVAESNDTEPLDASGNIQYYAIAQKGIESAIDGDRNTFWINTSQFAKTSGVTEVYGVIDIVIPTDILNNVYVNTVLVNPYPEYSMTITDIQYKGLGDQWNRLSTFPTTKDTSGNVVPVEIEECSKLLLSFPRVEMTEIKIMFKQPYWFEHEDSRFFIYGFQDIKLEYREYASTESEFVTTYSLDGTDRRFSSVQEPAYTPPVGCPQDIADCISHKMYYDSKLTEEFPFGHQISAPIQKVYIKTTLQKVGETIPFLKQMELSYSHKDLDE
jgi:hypothetical protein